MDDTAKISEADEWVYEVNFNFIQTKPVLFVYKETVITPF